MPRARNAKPEQSPRRGRAQQKTKPAAKGTASKPTGGSKKGRAYKRLPVTQQVRVGLQIAEMRLRPKAVTWPQISRETGVPIATAKLLYGYAVAWGEAHSDPSGRQVVDETLSLYDALMQRVAEVAEDTHLAAVELGSYRTIADLALRKLDLMAATGRLPRSWRAVDEVGVLQAIIRELIEEVVNNQDVPRSVIEKMHEVYQRMLPVVEGRPELTSAAA